MLDSRITLHRQTQFQDNVTRKKFAAPAKGGPDAFGDLIPIVWFGGATTWPGSPKSPASALAAGCTRSSFNSNNPEEEACSSSHLKLIAHSSKEPLLPLEVIILRSSSTPNASVSEKRRLGPTTSQSSQGKANPQLPSGQLSTRRSLVRNPWRYLSKSWGWGVGVEGPMWYRPY